MTDRPQGYDESLDPPYGSDIQPVVDRFFTGEPTGDIDSLDRTTRRTRDRRKRREQ